MQNSLKSICIVGGGTAGWMAASLLSTVLSSSNIKITLVESPDIETIGVGESTIPDIRDFLAACQIDLKEFVKATSATFKLGIRFDDWLQKGERYFHPFGRVGQKINGFDFYQVWLRSLDDEKGTDLIHHAPCATMAHKQKFTIPNPQSHAWLEPNFSYAFHLDATLFARFLRQRSIASGVERIEATVNEVVDDNGFIKSITLEDGRTISSDFFIDCTGFKALLIEKALKVDYQDWSKYLPCNRAVVVQTENHSPPSPNTIATAQGAGWMWNIPLQHRTGNGYVFASDFCTDQEACDTLLQNIKGTPLKGKPLREPKFIPFTTGKRNKILHNNCLALGLSSGFIEPLESTAIHLIYKILIHFIKHFPNRTFAQTNEGLFNRKIDVDYAEIRDFIVLHYCTTQRSDTEFWRWCQTMPIPDSLAQKLAHFKERAHLEHNSEQLFSLDSWWSVLEGMKVRPKNNHPLMAGFNPEQLAHKMVNTVRNINSHVQQMPLHQDFIAANCAATKLDPV